MTRLSSSNAAIAFLAERPSWLSGTHNEPSTAIFGPRQRGVPTAHACAVGCERSGPVVIRKRHATKRLTTLHARTALSSPYVGLCRSLYVPPFRSARARHRRRRDRRDR